MKLNHAENTKKFTALLGSEQRAKAAQDALAAKLGHMVTIKNLFVAVKALEGDRAFASQPEGIAIREVLNVMGPGTVSKAPTISTPPAQAIQMLAKPSAVSKKETAFQLIEEYGMLDDRRERAAFIKQYLPTLKDPASGVSRMALMYIEAGKDIPPTVRAGMYFTTT